MIIGRRYGGCRLADDGSSSVLVAERLHVERYALVLQRLDGLRVDNLRAAVCQFDCVHVVERVDFARFGEYLRVGVQNAVHVLPDGHRLGVENVRDDGCRVVRTLATERGRRTVGALPIKPCPTNTRVREPAISRRSSRRRFVDKDVRVLVARLRYEASAHVHPMIADSAAVEVLRHYRGRD